VKRKGDQNNGVEEQVVCCIIALSRPVILPVWSHEVAIVRLAASFPVFSDQCPILLVIPNFVFAAPIFVTIVVIAARSFPGLFSIRCFGDPHSALVIFWIHTGSLWCPLFPAHAENGDPAGVECVAGTNKTAAHSITRTRGSAHQAEEESPSKRHRQHLGDGRKALCPNFHLLRSANDDHPIQAHCNKSLLFKVGTGAGYLDP